MITINTPQFLNHLNRRIDRESKRLLFSLIFYYMDTNVVEQCFFETKTLRKNHKIF